MRHMKTVTAPKRESNILTISVPKDINRWQLIGARKHKDRRTRRLRTRAASDRYLIGCS